MIEEFPKTERKELREDIAQYEGLIWQEADEVSKLRAGLEQLANELYQTIQGKQGKANLYEEEQLRKTESEYWRIQKKLESLKETEDNLQRVLIDISDGKIDLPTLKKMFVKQIEGEATVSKRKQRILEEKKRLGFDPREIMSDMYGEFGVEKMHLTTGRNLRRVNLGSGVSSLDAGGEFYYRTSDTHGGKVAHGKHGPTYVSPSGKRIRKR